MSALFIIALTAAFWAFLSYVASCGVYHDAD